MTFDLILIFTTSFFQSTLWFWWQHLQEYWRQLATSLLDFFKWNTACFKEVLWSHRQGKKPKALPDRAAMPVSGCWSACVILWWSLCVPHFFPCLLFMAWKKDRSNVSRLLWRIIATTIIVNNMKRVDKFCGLSFFLYVSCVLGCSLTNTGGKKFVKKCPVRFAFCY